MMEGHDTAEHTFAFAAVKTHLLLPRHLAGFLNVQPECFG